MWFVDGFRRQIIFNTRYAFCVRVWFLCMSLRSIDFFIGLNVGSVAICIHTHNQQQRRQSFNCMRIDARMPVLKKQHRARKKHWIYKQSHWCVKTPKWAHNRSNLTLMKCSLARLVPLFEMNIYICSQVQIESVELQIRQKANKMWTNNRAAAKKKSCETNSCLHLFILDCNQTETIWNTGKCYRRVKKKKVV